jgi:hypothetical protein
VLSHEHDACTKSAQVADFFMRVLLAFTDGSLCWCWQSLLNPESNAQLVFP